MSSSAQILANQANSQLSTGPRTEAGKSALSHNNLRHGARSEAVLLPGEDPAEYEALLADLTAHFVPVDATELRSVREMADADWRLLRVRRSSADALTRRIAELAPDHPEASSNELHSRAIETLAASTGTSYATWLRHETKFERQYDRAYRDWLHYQTNRRRVSDKEADIWMRKAIFRPAPGEPPATTLPDAQHPAASLAQLASTVQNAEASDLSAQSPTQAVAVPETKMALNVQNTASRDLSAQDATRASVVRDTEKPSSVPKPPVAHALVRAASTLVSTPVSPAVAVNDSDQLGSTAQLPPQTPRNSPCPCGSGDKFKRCCGKNAPPVLGYERRKAA